MAANPIIPAKMIFASINPGFISSESLSLFWIVVIASFGALVVLVGVAMEVFWEKHWYKNISDFRFAESIKTWGGRLVVAGLVWEVFFGAGFAIKEEIDARNTKDEINKMDWRKHPIYAFSAKATIIVRPLEPVENLENLPRNLPTWLLDARLRLPRDGNEKPAMLILGISKQLADESFAEQSAEVESDNFSRSVVTAGLPEKPMALRYDIFFDEHSDNFQIGTLKPSELSGIELLLPLRCEVLDGKIEMVIDGGLTNRTFDIPPQKSLVDIVSSFETNGHFAPLNFSQKALKNAKGWEKFSKAQVTNLDFLNPPK